MRRRLLMLLTAIFLLTGLPQVEFHDHRALHDDIGALVHHLATEHRGVDDGGLHVHDGSLSSVVTLIDVAAASLPPTAMLVVRAADGALLPTGTHLPYFLNRPPALPT